MEIIQESTNYRFGDISLDVKNRQVWRDGVPVNLNSRSFDVLLLLLQKRGQLVSKQRIIDEVWNGAFVADSGLTQCVKDMRKQLGDNASNPRYIKTVPKQGYTFIAEVTEGQADPVPVQAHKRITTPDSGSRPYKFLDYFTEQDAPFFHGRDEEIEDILSRILTHNTLILHGRPGVGKSSIVLAGLTPRLRSLSHPILTIRSFSDPLRQMMRFVTKELGEGSVNAMPSREDQLIELLARLGAVKPAVVFFDHFEEFFLLLDDRARERFLCVIGELLLKSGPAVRLVFVLQEDLLSEMSLLKTAIPGIFQNEYRLACLGHEQAARAITEPAKLVGCSFELNLVARILDDLSEKTGINPLRLQIVCDHLYDCRDPSGNVTQAIYEQQGAASRILAGYLVRILSRFHFQDLHLVKTVLKSLISPDGQRVVLKISEVLARAGRMRARAEQLIVELIECRIIRGASHEGETWLELAHSMLIAGLSQWFSAKERALKQARAMISRSIEDYRSHSAVPDVEELVFLLEEGAQLGLASEEADFLLMSCLHRAHPAPDWLVHLAPSSAGWILAAARGPDADLRINAIRTALQLRDPDTESVLVDLALGDSDEKVRHVASLALAEWLGCRVIDALGSTESNSRHTLADRALSLAFVRESDASLVPLDALPMRLRFRLSMSLLRLRYRGGWPNILLGITGGAAGGAIAGMSGNVLLAPALAFGRPEKAGGSAPLVLVLAGIGVIAGLLGAFGISLGMVFAERSVRRHRRWCCALGAGMGGALVAGGTRILGFDAFSVLFHQHSGKLAGAVDGLILGVGVVLGGWLFENRKGSSTRGKIVGGALGGLCAGILLTMIGGDSPGGSLDLLAGSIAALGLDADLASKMFRQIHLGRLGHFLLNAVEGLLFGAGVLAGAGLSRLITEEKKAIGRQ